MSITIPEAVSEMLVIVDKLTKAYPKKKFTLDGRLVGDIGEALVEDAYELEVLEDLQKHHDALGTCGRLVQIKATMKAHLTFPADHVPDHYLGIQIHADGSFTEVFNGPGEIAKQALANRSRPKTNLHSVSVATLRKLQDQVSVSDRIPRRTSPRPSLGAERFLAEQHQ